MKESTKDSIRATSFMMLFMGAITLPLTLSITAIIYFKGNAENMNHKILKQHAADIILISLFAISLLVIGLYLFSVLACDSKIPNVTKLLTNEKLQGISKHYLQKKLKKNVGRESDVDTGSASIEDLKGALDLFIADIQSLKNAIKNSEERFVIYSPKVVMYDSGEKIILPTIGLAITDQKSFLVRDVNGVIKYQEIIKDRVPGEVNKNGILRDSQRMKVNQEPITKDELNGLIDGAIEIQYRIIGKNPDKDFSFLLYQCRDINEGIGSTFIIYDNGSFKSSASSKSEDKNENALNIKLKEMALNNKSMKAELITYLDEIIEMTNQEKTNLQDKIQKNPWKLNGIKEISWSDIKKTARSLIPCLD